MHRADTTPGLQRPPLPSLAPLAVTCRVVAPTSSASVSPAVSRPRWRSRAQKPARLRADLGVREANRRREAGQRGRQRGVFETKHRPTGCRLQRSCLSFDGTCHTHGCSRSGGYLPTQPLCAAHFAADLVPCPTHPPWHKYELDVRTNCNSLPASPYLLAALSPTGSSLSTVGSTRSL